MTKLSLRDTITPKSDQLNYDDFLSGPGTYQVATLGAGDKDQPVLVYLDGKDRPWKPCKSMRRLLIAVWGDKGREWIGRWITLFAEPAVKFGGVEVGGIRVSHLSGISEARTVKLTTSRAKRADYTVYPLSDDGQAIGEQADREEAT